MTQSTVCSSKVSLPGPLVEMDWLAAHLNQVRVLDVRMEPRSYAVPLCPEDEPLFAPEPLRGLTGHVPGAVAVPWKRLSEKRVEYGVEVSGMRPQPESFQALMRECGVDSDRPVVIAGRCANIKELAACTRLYWLLRYFGHEAVALLDGGVAQWAKSGLELDHEVVKPAEGNFQVRQEQAELLADLEEVRQTLGDHRWQVLDSRALDVYLGLTAPAKMVPLHGWGHISGAKLFSAKLIANRLGPATFYTPDMIEAAAKALKVDPHKASITYCNSGVLGSVTWFALSELLGNQSVRLFDGSMHQWSHTMPDSIVRFVLE